MFKKKVDGLSAEIAYKLFDLEFFAYGNGGGEWRHKDGNRGIIPFAKPTQNRLRGAHDPLC